MNDRSILSLATMLFVASFASHPCQGQQTVVRSRQIQPVVTMQGDASRIQKPQVARVTEQRELNVLWSEHRRGKAKNADVLWARKVNDQPNLSINFDRFMVVALFIGDTTNCSGIKVHEIVESTQRTTIRFSRRGLQSGPDPIPSTPYLMLVLPKSNNEITFEIGDRKYKNEGEWTWKTHSRIARGETFRSPRVENER